MSDPGVPPHSRDAEVSVVGQMLADPKIVGEVVGTVLDPEHFYVPAFRKLYGEIVEAYYADDPIDPPSIGTLSAKTLSRTATPRRRGLRSCTTSG